MKQTLDRILPMLAPYRARFALAQVAMLVSTAAGLAFPWAVRTVFDRLLGAANLRFLLVAVGLLALVSAAREVAEYAKNYNLEYIGQRILRDLRNRLYTSMLDLSLDYYHARSSGEVASYMSNDLQQIQQGISSGLSYVLQQVLSLFAVVIVLFRIDAVLAAAILGAVPLIVLISRTLGSKVRAIAQRVQAGLATLMATVNEFCRHRRHQVLCARKPCAKPLSLSERPGFRPYPEQYPRHLASQAADRPAECLFRAAHHRVGRLSRIWWTPDSARPDCLYPLFGDDRGADRDAGGAVY